LKMIFIAGNEPFTQGSVWYELACGAAKAKGVVVNTIYCGDFNDDISLSWKRGADLTGGAFMSIDQNSKTAYVPTPYDDQIAALNDKLNATYVYYGASGEHRKEQQIIQDKNAASYGLANIAERSFCKSSHAYKNSSWDLVDAAKDNEKVITETRSDDLPDEMRTMSIEQRKVYIKQKSEERKKIQAEIQSLNKKRQEYISKNTPQSSKDKMLDASMMKAIKEQGSAKNLKWEAFGQDLAQDLFNFDATRKAARIKEVMQDNEYVSTGYEKGIFFINPLMLNGKPLDYGDFNIQSKGELTVTKGATKTGQTTQIPFYVYLRRNGNKVLITGKERSDPKQIKIEISEILRHAEPGDHVVIEAVRKEDGPVKRILKLPGRGC